MAQYISPFSLLQDVLPGQEVDKKSLLLAKKKLLAELELSGGNTIIIKNQEFSKNDIIQYFDGLQQAEIFLYHLLIAEDTVLLLFLEKNELKNGQRFKDAALYQAEAFIDWISIYFYTSFAAFAETCFFEYKDDEWRTLLDNTLLMNSQYGEDAWQTVEMLVGKDFEALQYFIKFKGDGDRVLVESVSGFRYISMLQCLPNWRFSDFKDRYAYAVMQSSVYVFNRINRSKAMIMVENAWLLAVSEETKKAIADKEAEMDGIIRNPGRAKRRWTIGSWSGRGAFFLIFVILKVIASVNSDSSNNYNFNNNTPIYYKPPGDSAERMILPDSITQQIQRLNSGDTLRYVAPASTDPGSVDGKQTAKDTAINRSPRN